MLDDEALRRIDDLARYLPGGSAEPRSIAASGYAISDLYRGDLLPEAQMEVLAEVVDIVELGGSICETEELLDAWLEAFEVLSSVRPDEVGAPPAEGKEGKDR